MVDRQRQAIGGGLLPRIAGNSRADGMERIFFRFQRISVEDGRMDKFSQDQPKISLGLGLNNGKS